MAFLITEIPGEGVGKTRLRRGGRVKKEGSRPENPRPERGGYRRAGLEAEPVHPLGFPLYKSKVAADVFPEKSPFH